ncbi:Camk4, partial [Symbiodinium sp. KB8]
PSGMGSACGALAVFCVTGEGATRDYFIESNLGHGSFGEVFRARHRHQPSRTVALKVMARERIKVTSIQREFAVMEAMGSHPGIVGYHGCYKTPEKVTFVLELMNGGELFERLVHKGAYTEAEARPAFRRIARALAYLHSRGIVHRDLKEDSYTSEIKIADFGLSQLVRGCDLRVCGTWAYAAPEMADAARPGYDTKFDTWGYGV